MRMNGSFKKVVGVVGFILGVMVLAVGFSMLHTEKAYAKEVSLGICRVSAYCPNCNTPRGSRRTSTGHIARGHHTIAVDAHDPRVGYGAKLKIKAPGYEDDILVVEDCGGFGRYGKDFDLFFDTEAEENEWGQRDVEVILIVPETKEEKKARLVKEKAHKEAKKGAKEAAAIHADNHGILTSDCVRNVFWKGLKAVDLLISKYDLVQ